MSTPAPDPTSASEAAWAPIAIEATPEIPPQPMEIQEIRRA
jgi:hypothetical protein